MSFPPANMNRAIDPTSAQVRDLRDNGPEGPVVMLNLLKFRDRAAYPDGHPDAGSTGREAYARYQHNFTVSVGAVSRAEVLYDGPVMRCFIGDADLNDWDQMLIVRYPSRGHFLAMMADEGYKAGLVHRYAGLERTVLLQCGDNAMR
ncbi:DUF1330 domain-containing protein [Sandaracinobacteroides sp. A072]|uniref:DUF1330 domain-containing protein n=1 Tax=Sandaracinobacteroides sp. A072 TaxID=3461146 RepID=UPI004041F947